MGQSGSPSGCRQRPECQRQDPYQGGLAEGGPINRRGDPKVAGLSRSFQGCSLRGPSLHRKVECPGLQGPHCGPKGSPPEDLRHPPFPHGRMAAGLLIDRSSLFCSNAGEKLEKFLSEKLGVWGQSSPRSWGPASCREEPGLRPLWQGLPGKVGAPEGPLWGRGEGGSGSTWILPQCRVSHLQRCRACQAFNQEQTPTTPCAGRWAPLQEEEEEEKEEGHSAGSGPHQNKGMPPRSKQQASCNRVSKVRRWLERTPGTEWPPVPETHRERRPKGQSPSSPGTPGYASPGQRDGGLWATTGGAADGQRMEEAGPPRKGHPGEETQLQPAAWVLPCNGNGDGEEAKALPAGCDCAFCKRHPPPSGPSAWERAQPDPSAGEVGRLLQAENRVSRIVEAFERRSLWEAKMAEEQEKRAFEGATRRDPMPQEHACSRTGTRGPS